MPLPTPVADLLATAFGGAPRDVEPTIGGFSHRSALVTLGPTRCVVKLADVPMKRADLRHESRVLAALRGTGVPAPEPLALLADEQWTVEVLRALPGASGARLFEGPADRLPQVYRALGAAVRAIHSSSPAHGPVPELGSRFEAARAALPDLPLEPELRDALIAALEHPEWHTPTAGLTHGDAGIHNVLWDGRIVALLDWEWAGWGNTLLDLSWVYWTIRWRRLPPDCWEAFLGGYGAASRPARPGAYRALALGQIATILPRAASSPSAWGEWLRRLRWTLGLEFPDREGP